MGKPYTEADNLAARELVKAANNPAHWGAIDAGHWDAFLLMERAREQIAKERKGK